MRAPLTNLMQAQIRRVLRNLQSKANRSTNNNVYYFWYSAFDQWLMTIYQYYNELEPIYNTVMTSTKIYYKLFRTSYTNDNNEKKTRIKANFYSFYSIGVAKKEQSKKLSLIA